jgi:ornithine carbamoyltransferase
MSFTKHFLEVDDLSPEEIIDVLNRSEVDNLPPCLTRQSVALLFEKPSTRTRHSIEAAITQLGGNSVYTRPEEVGIDVRETAEDISRTLSGYHSAIAARVFEHSVLERMSSVSTVPIINLLSNDSHPVQTLADLLTIRQEFGELKGKRIAFVGDACNVAFSLAIGAKMVGAQFVIAHPENYGFDANDNLKFASKNIQIESTTDCKVAVNNADVIYTDSWYAMGQEDEAEKRRIYFARYQVNDELMYSAPEHAIFMHCLPAHRGEEATNSVLDGPQSRIWQQAENRMHSMRGLLSVLLG